MMKTNMMDGWMDGWFKEDIIQVVAKLPVDARGMIVAQQLPLPVAH
jgi:hypothetical protein